MRFVKRVLLAIIAMAMAGYVPPARAADGDMQSREYPIVAAYIYNFLQFTTWPPGSLENGLAICVLGNNPFGELLTPLKNKTAQNVKIIIQHHAAGSSLSGCDVLFISNSESDVKSILASLKNAPVLTMSNISGFADSGGMVEFDKEDTKIGMHINNKAVGQAGLAISSKLLSLAHIVE